MKKIGITTTVPLEVLYAAGYTPVDLNNVFVMDNNYNEYIDIAEMDGFPKSTCAWIKGIYGVCIKNGINEIVGVVEGDCSNTQALLEVLELKGIRIYPFAYPRTHTVMDVEREIKKFMGLFGVKTDEVEAVRHKLNRLRKLTRTIDKLTYVDGRATGFENHLYQVSMSDLNGNAELYEKKLKQVILEIFMRKPNNKNLRLAYVGVPPMTADLYNFVENLDARFVYNEVQREFAFPRASRASDIFEQYYDYTYPYDIEFRISEIKKQIENRKIDAVIHYTQAFCYRAIQDIVFRERLNIPLLSIEGDRQNSLDARTKLRIEAFIDMLKDMKGGWK